MITLVMDKCQNFQVKIITYRSFRLVNESYKPPDKSLQISLNFN